MMLQVIKRETTGRIIRNREQKSPALQKEKTGVWVQVDLGASYPLEVINLKRQVYDGQATIGNGNPSGQGKRLKGTKISYKNTAIVIGNEEDLSDGQIVYYEGNPTLPDGVKQPENVSKPYEEAMGGQWFYMDYATRMDLGPQSLEQQKRHVISECIQRIQKVPQ